jgi:hypothetical protein
VKALRTAAHVGPGENPREPRHLKDGEGAAGVPPGLFEAGGDRRGRGEINVLDIGFEMLRGETLCRAPPPGLAQAPGLAGIAKKAGDRDRQPGRVARRHGERFHPIAGDLRNAGVERGIDDRTARRHRLELREPEGFGIRHRRQHKDFGRM